MKALDSVDALTLRAMKALIYKMDQCITPTCFDDSLCDVCVERMCDLRELAYPVDAPAPVEAALEPACTGCGGLGAVSCYDDESGSDIESECSLCDGGGQSRALPSSDAPQSTEKEGK